MSPASASVAERVRERVRAEGFDPAAESDRAADIVRAELRRHNDFASARGIPTIDDEASCLREVLAALAGFGPLQPYLDDPSIEEVWLNAPDRIFFARGGVAYRAPLVLSDAAVRDLVERMLQSSGRRVDLSQPFVDASLPDGSRLHVVIPDTGGASYRGCSNSAEVLPGSAMASRGNGAWAVSSYSRHSSV